LVKSTETQNIMLPEPHKWSKLIWQKKKKVVIMQCRILQT